MDDEDGNNIVKNFVFKLKYKTTLSQAVVRKTLHPTLGE